MRYFEAKSGDVTTELQALLDAGPGIVHLGPGEFHCAGLRLHDGVVLAGEGRATVLRLSEGEAIIDQRDAGEWGLRDLVLDGGDDGEWPERSDRGAHGLRVHGCWGYDVANVVVRNVAGCGMRIAYTDLFAGGNAPFCNGGNLDRVTVHDCHTGICFDTRGEYLNAVAISAYHNVTGVVIHAGNVKLTGSNICTNVDGVYIEDHENGSHGALANCLINHNLRHALHGRQVRNGMMVANCNMAYGALTLEECRGVTVSGCQLCCQIRISGADRNSLLGNYVVPYPGICDTFEITPSTHLSENYTGDQVPYTFT